MIKLSCNSCNKIHSFKDDSVHIHTLGTDVRQMGIETAYSGMLEAECSNCGNRMRAEFSFWEYPKGTLNFKEIDSQGCAVVEEPDYINSYINDERKRRVQRNMG